MPKLTSWRKRLGPGAGSGLVAWTLLCLAAATEVVFGPGPVLVVLATAAALAFSLQKRFGPLAAGLLVAIALPYGRGADTLVWQPLGITLRPQDGVLLVALLGGCWTAYRNRGQWRAVPRGYLAAFGAFLLVGLMALVVGLANQHALRDILRDARVWIGFSAGLLALLSGTPRAAIVRGLLQGATALAVVIAVATLLPAFEGGLKAQTLDYDRGTLRMQFGNSIFLLPAVAYATLKLLQTRRPLFLGWLSLLLAALVLSLTRMSILATLAVVIGTAVLWFLGSRPAVARGLAATALLGGSIVVAGVGGLVLNEVGTPPLSGVDSPGSSGENAVDRLLGLSDSSDFGATLKGGRTASYLAAYAIIRQQPAIGSGMGTLVATSYAYSAARAHTIGYQSGVDNAYLTAGVKAGAIGVAILATLLLLPLVSMARGRTRGWGWLLPAWLGILFLTLPQAFAMSGYGPFGLTLLLVVPVLRPTPTRLRPAPALG